MWTGLMLFVGSYIFCVCMLHALKRPNEEVRSYHLLLVTKDNQLHIEWYIRSCFSGEVQRKIADRLRN